jgi:hypothetical protein
MGSTNSVKKVLDLIAKHTEKFRVFVRGGIFFCQAYSNASVRPLLIYLTPFEPLPNVLSFRTEIVYNGTDIMEFISAGYHLNIR